MSYTTRELNINFFIFLLAGVLCFLAQNQSLYMEMKTAVTDRSKGLATVLTRYYKPLKFFLIELLI